VVPVSMAMLFIPVTLLILHTVPGRNQGKHLWLLLLLIGGTILLHPPTEVVLTVLAVFYLAGFVMEALVQKRYGEGINLLLAIGVRITIPVVILGLWLPSLTKTVLEQSVSGASLEQSGSGQSVSGASSIITLLGVHTGFPQAFGTIAVVVSIVGLFLARGDGVRRYMLPLFTLLLLVFLVFAFPLYRLGPGILYERGWLYLGLLMAIFAGYAVTAFFRSVPALARVTASWLRRSPSNWLAASLYLGGIAVVLLALTTGLVVNGERQMYAQYYHVINDAIFADFRWMGWHTTSGQMVAMGEPS
jgi:hypothetical protein